MADRLPIPPQKMVREFPVPEHTAGFFNEILSKESPRYQSVYPIKRGTLYSTVQGGDVNTSASFAPLYFLKEQRYGTSDTLVIWTWATDQNAQNSYNAEVDYSGDSTSHPAYVRVYTIRRDVYDAAPSLATGTALTALIAITVTAGGTGYAATDTVNIAGGLGATAELVVSSTGVIQSVIVTNGGSGYDSAALPAITITTATGAGATLAAVVQIKTAVLTSQKKVEIGRDPQNGESVYSSEFVRVIRAYEVLPGPWIPFTRWDDTLGPIQGRRRAVLNTSQIPTLTETTKTTYEGREGSSVVSWQIEETHGTGVAPAFPIILDKERSAAVRGEVVTTAQQAVEASEAPESGSLIISSTHEGIDAYYAKRRTKSVAQLPADEKWAHWDFVPIPMLLTAITNTFFCNNSQFFTLVTNITSTGGSSAIRKHRTTVKYHSTFPNLTPDLSGSAFTTRDIRYAGKVINFSFNNVLNDAISYDEDFYTSSGGSACFWTEAYSFTASTPSATTFAAGAWYTRSYTVEPWGTEGFRSVHTEFYSASGNPTIV